MHLVTTEQMRRLEEAAVAAGSTWEGLMEQAGWGVAQCALQFLGDARKCPVLVLVGPGNNGGDALVAARHLHDAGATVSLYLWKRSPDKPDANWQRCRERQLAEVLAADDNTSLQSLKRLLAKTVFVIDGLLGMGTSRPVEGQLAEIIAAVNEGRALMKAQMKARSGPGFRVLSIDVPTGVQSDTGAILGTAIEADVTVATGLVKQGLLLYPGKRCAGDIALADIGLAAQDLEALMSNELTREHARSLLPARPEDAHKGTFGKAMVVAGSPNYPGAAMLATAGAARAGAGLVTLANVRGVLAASGRRPEVTLLPLLEGEAGSPGREGAATLLKELAGYDALLMGCGLGQEGSIEEFIQHLFGMEKARQKAQVGFRSKLVTTETSAPAQEEERPELPPMVLDADALNLLAKIANWHEHLPRERCILTPHPGEMKRLLGTDELDADYVAIASDAATRWGQVVVLKAATTVIAAPDGRSLISATGNPALATAGTGDVLAGIIVALLAQGLALWDAAALGVYLHAAAGARVREDMGDMGALASDLLPHLPHVIKTLKSE